MSQLATEFDHPLTTRPDSIRFAPPLVIDDSDLRRAIEIIEESLKEIDELDRIPGDEGEEHDVKIELED